MTISLAMPMFVAVLVQEFDIATRMIVYIIGGAFIFTAPILAIIDRAGNMTRRESIMLVALVWTMIPTLFAIPLMDMTELSFIDALFETVSGLTTTGASVIDIYQMPKAILFWRTQMQWVGGALAIMTIYAIMAPLKIGGINIEHGIAATNIGEKKMIELFNKLISVYVIITMIAFLAFMMCGVRSFHAAGLAMAAVSTGGFIPFSGNIDNQLGNSGMIIFACTLTIGATSIIWHTFITPSGNQNGKNKENGFVITTIIVLALVFAVALTSIGEANSIIKNIIKGFFNAAAIVSTFGVESQYGTFALLPLPLVLFVVLVGGSVLSTAGGIKHSRIGAMIMQSWNELDRLVYPSTVRNTQIGKQKYDTKTMQAIWSFYVITIITLCIGTLVIAYSAPSMEAALTATITTFATAAPIYESAWGSQWPQFYQFTTLNKCVMMILMILGRLEVLTIVALIGLYRRKNYG